MVVDAAEAACEVQPGVAGERESLLMARPAVRARAGACRCERRWQWARTATAVGANGGLLRSEPNADLRRVGGSATDYDCPPGQGSNRMNRIDHLSVLLQVTLQGGQDNLKTSTLGGQCPQFGLGMVLLRGVRGSAGSFAPCRYLLPCLLVRLAFSLGLGIWCP